MSSGLLAPWLVAGVYPSASRAWVLRSGGARPASQGHGFPALSTAAGCLPTSVSIPRCTLSSVTVVLDRVWSVSAGTLGTPDPALDPRWAFGKCAD